MKSGQLWLLVVRCMVAYMKPPARMCESQALRMASRVFPESRSTLLVHLGHVSSSVKQLSLIQGKEERQSRRGGGEGSVMAFMVFDWTVMTGHCHLSSRLRQSWQSFAEDAGVLLTPLLCIGPIWLSSLMQGLGAVSTTCEADLF